MPTFRHSAQVRPYFGYRNSGRLKLTARALRMGDVGWEHSGSFRKLAVMLSQFASQEVPALEVTLQVLGLGDKEFSFTKHTDGEGFVHFDVEAGVGIASTEHPTWELARLHWNNRDGPQSADAFILSPGEDHRLAVISDIDDTIIETGLGDLSRNWRRVLAQMPCDRQAVPGAASFFSRLSGEDVGSTLPATRRPFFYVSSSPWNLFEYIVAFKKLHKLPQGPILLRDWDLNRATFSSHGHKTHKARSIEALIEFYPGIRFALIGDNTQADAMAYAEVVEKHPGRIAAVFIRQAPGADLGQDELAAFAAIQAAGVKLWTGDSYEVGADFLESLGFTPGGETTQIVDAIEKRPSELDALKASSSELPPLG